MRDLYLKRNKLCDLSFMLRNEQFNAYLNKEQLSLIIKNRKEVYKRFKFYDNFIKNRRIVKDGRKEIRSKER